MAWSSDISRRAVLKRAKRITAAAPLLSVIGCDGSPGGEAWMTLSGSTMGTRYRIKAMRPGGRPERNVLRTDIEDILETVNDQMSTYRMASELSRFNAAASTGWITVSPDTAQVAAEALRVGRLSAGAFDVTIGPLVDLWGFGPTAPPLLPPSAGSIRARLEKTGHANLDVRNDSAAMRKSQPGLHVDLCGIAKGYAVDRIADHLKRLGLDNFLVEIGGEMRVKGSSPFAKDWRIGIEKPVAGRRAIQRVVRLDNAAIATSGDYRIFFERDGGRYSHIIDPRTGAPISHSLASVTVIAPTTMAADAWSTALMVLGPDDGLDLAEGLKLPALFIAKTDRGFREIRTSSFSQTLAI